MYQAPNSKLDDILKSLSGDICCDSLIFSNKSDDCIINGCAIERELATLKDNREKLLKIDTNWIKEDNISHAEALYILTGINYTEAKRIGFNFDTRKYRYGSGYNEFSYVFYKSQDILVSHFIHWGLGQGVLVKTKNSQASKKEYFSKAIKEELFKLLKQNNLVVENAKDDNGLYQWTGQSQALASYLCNRLIEIENSIKGCQYQALKCYINLPSSKKLQNSYSQIKNSSQYQQPRGYKKVDSIIDKLKNHTG